MRVAVIGAGSWGTAVSWLLGGKGHEIQLWAREPEIADGVNATRHNPLYLRDIVLPETVSASPDIAVALDGAEAVVMVTPSVGVRATGESMRETLPADTAFYLLKIEAYRIGTSDPAPLFTIVAGPSVESKQIGGQKKELAERHILRLEFWKALLEISKSKTRLFERISPGKDSWISVGAGRSGITYAFVIRMQDAQVEFYIDRMKVEENKAFFDALFREKSKIEATFGSALDWQRLDARRSCRIRYVIEGHGLLDREDWPTLQEQMVDAMVKLHKAFDPWVHNIDFHE